MLFEYLIKIYSLYIGKECIKCFIFFSSLYVSNWFLKNFIEYKRYYYILLMNYFCFRRLNLIKML